MVTMKFYYLNRSLETRTGVTWNYTMLETALESSTVPGARMGFGTRNAVSLGGWVGIITQKECSSGFHHLWKTKKIAVLKKVIFGKLKILYSYCPYYQLHFHTEDLLEQSCFLSWMSFLLLEAKEVLVSSLPFIYNPVSHAFTDKRHTDV